MYQFVRELMRDILSTKEVIHHATFEIPKEWKNVVSHHVATCVEILTRNENMTSKEQKIKTFRSTFECRAIYKPSKVGGLPIVTNSVTVKPL